jgi:hypothetical protein
LRRARGRRFGLTVGGAFGALGTLLAWRGASAVAVVTASVSGLLLAGGIVVPALLLPVERAWMAMAHVISRVTTPLLIAVLYFVVITPVGMTRRAFGQRPLSRRGDSVWITRATTARRSDLTRQF